MDRHSGAQTKPTVETTTAIDKKAQIQKQVEEIRQSVKAVTGIDSGEVAEWLGGQATALQSLGAKHEAKDGLKRIARATCTLGELRPEGAVQAMLAVQMIGVHEAAVQCLRNAFCGEQTVEGFEADVSRATRLMHLFNERLEAVQKLKGTSGQQKVTVEHVHIHRGAQAVVGALTSVKGGGVAGDKREK